ncbi:hypothetical protein LINPERHAP2_LOCUS17722 [Linum perenne]
MEESRRPNRSDDHLSAEQEAKIEQQTRGYFDDIAPKRHTKPQRSDPSAKYIDSLPQGDESTIPELVEFQRLENSDTHESYDGRSEGAMVREEFVETEYYKDLNCVDKQHHTTGTGFIKMESEADGKPFHLEHDEQEKISSHESGRGNPATNEWIPAAADNVDFDSDKPSRSDN